MLPSRWQDRPQAWAAVLAKMAWFERHLDRLGLGGAPGAGDARELVERIEWHFQLQPEEHRV